MTRPYPDLRRLQHCGRRCGRLHPRRRSAAPEPAGPQQLDPPARKRAGRNADRDGRRVTWTPAGRQLHSDARTLLAAVYTVTDHVQRAASAARENYVVGHTPALESVEATVEPVIDAYHDVSFTFRQMFPDQLSPALLDGSIQLPGAAARVPDRDLATAVLGYHAVRVAVLSSHPWRGVRTPSTPPPTRRTHRTLGTARRRTTATCCSAPAAAPDSSRTMS